MENDKGIRKEIGKGIRKDRECDMKEELKRSNASCNARTDLALEVRESFEEDNVEISGVVLEEDYVKDKDIKITRVVIKDKHGQEAMGKPMGTYITIEAPHLQEDDESYHEPLTEEIVRYIKELLGDYEKGEVLIAGLGNREVTPDALGPKVVDNLFVTRHLIKEYGEEFKTKNKMESMSAIAPGVMGQTGMETSEILKGIIKQTKPKCIIAIDALAARSVSRLNTTIQITDTGISPGSGVGNHRNALNEECLGVKVIAIGVPTVVDGATIVNDTLERFLDGKGFSEKEMYTFMAEVREKMVCNMFVTPKGIDDAVKRISYTISEALNQCFCQAM